MNIPVIPSTDIIAIYSRGQYTVVRELPLFSARVPAGFPSPADDYIDRALDLNEHLIRHPAATFFVRVSGDSMVDAGIHPGDILVVDRAEEPAHGKIVIAALDGELTVKRLSRHNGTISLLPENPAYAPIQVTPEMRFEVWGVVVHVIHTVG
jgi:DNA polymerase V